MSAALGRPAREPNVPRLFEDLRRCLDHGARATPPRLNSSRILVRRRPPLSAGLTTALQTGRWCCHSSRSSGGSPGSCRSLSGGPSGVWSARRGASRAALVGLAAASLDVCSIRRASSAHLSPAREQLEERAVAGADRRAQIGPGQQPTRWSRRCAAPRFSTSAPTAPIAAARRRTAETRCAGECFDDIEELRVDQAGTDLRGARRGPAAATARQFARRFRRCHIQAIGGRSPASADAWIVRLAATRARTRRSIWTLRSLKWMATSAAQRARVTAVWRMRRTSRCGRNAAAR